MAQLGTWVSALCVIGIFSFIWKENPYYRFLEHLFVGLASGQAVAAAYGVIVNSAVKPIAKGSIALIIPVILGLMLYLRYFRQVAWLAKIPTSLLLGIGLGAGTAASIASDVVAQTKANLIAIKDFTSFVLVFSFITTLSYFFFTLFVDKNKAAGGSKIAGYLSTAGRWSMMIFFGAQVGNVTAGRLSMVINKFQFLLADWLKIIKI
jgi:hypothetical protein